MIKVRTATSFTDGKLSREGSLRRPAVLVGLASNLFLAAGVAVGVTGCAALPEDESAPKESVGVTAQASTSCPPVMIAIGRGYDQNLAVAGDGTVWGWGLNSGGQLGNGTTTNALIPGQIPPANLSNVIAVASSATHSIALLSNGTVWAWGTNTSGQVGDGTTTTRLSPVQVPSLSNVIAIAAGADDSLALKSNGTVWAWGYNGNGELGDGTTTTRLSPVQTLISGVTAIAAPDSADQSFAIKSNGTLFAWGYNGDGALGDGTTTNRSTPVQVTALTKITAVAPGGRHTLALRSDGTVWSWGYNGYGELGNGTTTNQLTPGELNTISGVTAIGAGNDHSLAATKNGTVYAWGENNRGQVGDGTTTNRTVPTKVPSLQNATALGGGWASSIAQLSDGAVWTWGANSYGQLGEGTTTDDYSPELVTVINCSVP